MAAVISTVAVPLSALRGPAVNTRSAGRVSARPLAFTSSFHGAAFGGVAKSRSVRKFSPLPIRAADQVTETDISEKTEEIIEKLKTRWEKVENKSAVVIYGAGALVTLWFSSTIVGAVNSIPVLPKLLELIGLGYSGWFVYRYLLFKSSRQELAEDIEELKNKITGTVDSAAKDIEDTDTFKTAKSVVKEDVKPVADSVTSSARDTYRDAYSAGKESKDDTEASVKDATSNVKDATSSVGTSIKEATKEATSPNVGSSPLSGNSTPAGTRQI